MNSADDLQTDIDTLRTLIDGLLERSDVSDDDLTLRAATLVLDERQAALARLREG